MKAAVLGVGRMGTAICYAMRKLGFHVVGVDSYAGAADNFRKYQRHFLSIGNIDLSFNVENRESIHTLIT